MKIVIPVVDEVGNRLSGHFGRAPYFAWFQVEGGEIVERGIAPNDSEHFGGRGLPPERMMAMGADVVISTGMGMRAINMFQQSTVAVLKATSLDSEANITEFLEGRLMELTEGCLHARGH